MILSFTSLVSIAVKTEDGSTMKIHHIAYAVTSIEKSKIKFEDLGFKATDTEPVNDDIRNIKILFMMHDESKTLIELVEPLNDTSPITNLCKKMHGCASPYHICYEVENLSEALSEFKSKGYLVTQKPAPAVAIEGKNVAFLFQKDVGIIELVESL